MTLYCFYKKFWLILLFSVGLCRQLYSFVMRVMECLKFLHWKQKMHRQ